MLAFFGSFMIDFKLFDSLKNIQKYSLPFQLKRETSIN